MSGVRTPYNPSAAPGVLPSVPLATAAGAAAVGNPSGMGRSPQGVGFGPYAGATQTAQLPHVLGSDAPIFLDLPPDSLYVSRELHGGAVYVGDNAPNQYQWAPPMTGGFNVIAHQPALAPIQGEQMAAQSYQAPSAWRDAPPVVDLCRRVPADVGSGA